MNVELKNVKHCKWASQETECFTASLYIDKKRVGTVENDGNGGCNFMHFNDRATEKNFIDFCNSQPPKVYEDGTELSMDADFYISLLLEEHLKKAEEKRWLRTMVIFRLKDDEEGAWRTVKAKKDKAYREKVVEFLNKKYEGQIEVIKS